MKHFKKSLMIKRMEIRFVLYKHIYFCYGNYYAFFGIIFGALLVDHKQWFKVRNLYIYSNFQTLKHLWKKTAVCLLFWLLIYLFIYLFIIKLFHNNIYMLYIQHSHKCTELLLTITLAHVRLMKIAKDVSDGVLVIYNRCCAEMILIIQWYPDEK